MKRYARLVLAILFVLTSATSLLLSSLYVRFRDVAIMTSRSCGR